MVSKQWRVRFALTPTPPVVPSAKCVSKTSNAKPLPARSRPKSKLACHECKSRRVKCDETYPVCGHCKRRGTLCIPVPRHSGWHLELPLLIQQACNPGGTSPSLLLQYYFERVCHIMVLDPENNPLAFPLLTLMKESDALLHVVQSIAAAHKHGFADDATSECLFERKRALLSIQKELRHVRKQSVSTFLAIFLMGISSPWIEGTSGMEHLLGARALGDILLNDPNVDYSSAYMQMILGSYIWWEMAASFNLDHRLQRPLGTDAIYKAVMANRLEYHSLTGYSLELFYLIANLNHYCRRIVDGEPRDLAHEAAVEEQLLNWKPGGNDTLLVSLSGAYRKHGLIQLRRICGPNNGEPDLENERQIQTWAAEAMENLMEIPHTSPYLNFQPIPLLSAASEISSDNRKQQEEVKARFRALYSLTHLPVMLDAITLLEEIWELRPLGIKTSWAVVLLETGKLLPLA
ncbi:unnamed protein product [Clonostachys solani]|uniref:Zn(2)-C6 fungal-type domain-containing protein n=1 Tax=Clonostachys solani TaxID=160281 RepID=A0A9N9ZN53_9HYPO|nr:unnamed protein product [Clonostachys solani]